MGALAWFRGGFRGGATMEKTPPYVEGATTYSGALSFLEEGAIFGGRLTIFRGALNLEGRLAWAHVFNHKVI